MKARVTPNLIHYFILQNLLLKKVTKLVRIYDMLAYVINSAEKKT